MTKELKEALDRELDAALESGDPKQIDRALINSQKAVASCQMKTAERVKVIAADHPLLVQDVRDIKALVSTTRQQLWKVALSAFKWIAIGGGGAEFIRYLASGN